MPVQKLSMDELVSLFQAQCKSVDLWVKQFQENRNISGLRNAALAIGKLYGIFSAMIFMIQGDENLPDGIIDTINIYNKVWDDIQSSSVNPEIDL